MHHYRSFSARQFAEDEFFQRWVKHGSTDAELDHAWKDWLAANGDKAETVEEARGILLPIYRDQQFFPPVSTRQRMWDRIEATLNREAGLDSHTGSGLAEVNQRPQGDSRRLVAGWYKWAAAAVIALTAGTALYVSSSRQENVVASRSEANTTPTAKTLSVMADIHAVTVALDDGSSVVLQPHSKLTYPEHFGNGDRQVTLSGEGFFEITRDMKRPFFVKTSHITTRVLGTSFSVRLYPGDNKATVRVKTGNVSVFRDPAVALDPAEVVLSPNQQVIYNVADDKLTRSQAIDQDPVAPVARIVFEFQDTPLSDVFNLIEAAYNVTVEYDPQTFGNCSLNASLNDVPFHEKLRLICKAIGATYKMEDNRIIVSGRGC